MTVNPVIEIPKSSVDAFELPCGYLDEEGKVHTSVEVREIRGNEEEILAAKNMPMIKKLNKIMANCTLSVGTYRQSDINNPIEKIVPDLTQGDRFYLMFAIRRVSLGDEMPFISKCPECGQEQKLTIDLSELEIKKMPDPKIRTYLATLPKSGKQLMMKVLTGRGEEAITKSSKSAAPISIALLQRIESLDGKPPTVEDILDLGMADRNFLRDVWQEHEGGIETTIEAECSSCGAEYETDIDFGAEGFFNPLAVLKAWKKKSSS